MNPISDKNISDCFTIDFEHKKDDRTWKTIKGLTPVPGLVKKGRFEEALAILDDQKKSLDDLDFIYAWKAFIFQKQQKHDRAEEILLQGIKNAKAKNLLCDRLGYLYCASGNMENAVKWWIKSILIMTRNKASFLWEPFLYLAYTAKGCGCNKEYQLLINIAWQSHGEIALKKEAEADLLAKAAHLKASFVPQAIQTLGTLLETHGPADNATSEDLSNSDKLGIPVHSPDNHLEEKHSFHAWKWVIAALALAAAVFFLFFSPFLNRPDQAQPPPVPTPVSENRDTSLPSDNSPPPGTNPVQPDPPAADVQYHEPKTAETEQVSNPDIPLLPGENFPLSELNSKAPVGHKIRAVYLKNKTKQPISNLHKKNQ